MGKYPIEINLKGKKYKTYAKKNRVSTLRELAKITIFPRETGFSRKSESRV
jgi:hypothetical protein